MAAHIVAKLVRAHLVTETHQSFFSASDFGCAASKICPISRGPCPGECIFADVMASVGLGIVVVNLAARSVLFANPGARELMGRVGVPMEFESLEQLLLLRGGEPIAVGEAEGRAQQVQIGSRFLGFTVYSARGFAWVFVRDITEKVRLESIAAAVETTNNIGYVFSAVRHEIGNPINSIKVALGVLEANLDVFKRDAIAEYVARMSTEVERIERLLRSLRSFSLYERPELVSLDLPGFLQEFCALVRPELDARGIRLGCHVEPSVVARCDPRVLHQVLMNLVTNAVDALAHQAEPRIDLDCACSEALVTLRVGDNGVGIAEEQQAELFKPFSTTKPHGTGLGLVIARKLMAAMDGTIAIDTSPGAGTRVSLALPAGAEPGEPTLS